MIPIYSDDVVALARAYDRAALACCAGSWHFSSLKDDYEENIYGGPDGLPAYAEGRLNVLEASLPDFLRVVSMMIKKESEPFFQVTVGADGNIDTPEQVQAILGQFHNPVIHFAWSRDVHAQLKKEAVRLAKEFHVIVFDEEIHTVPKHIPASFVEIWWRRLCWNGPGGLYEMCLVPNPDYGWDCLGHER